MKRTLLGLLLCLAAAWPDALRGQTGAVLMGRITGPGSEPLAGVQVLVEPLGLGTLTNAEGAYSIVVPAAEVRGQTVAVTARSIGYRSASRTVTLSAGTQTVSFELVADVLRLEGVVVTGVAGETMKQKLAFTVSQVGAEQLRHAPPAANPVRSLQGRVPGVQVVGTGSVPGGGVAVRLRGTTSISGTSQPLYIVDGVILSSGQVDIDAHDIESIEVVKGAAASSIYGSRAQNGVIRITTNRGGRLAAGRTRITVRNEFGYNQLQRRIPRAQHHIYMVADSAFLDAEGNQVQAGDYLRIKRVGGVDVAVKSDYANASVNRGVNGVVFQDNPYPGTLYDHVDRFFDPGMTVQNYVGIRRNTDDTNFMVSFGNVREQGVVGGLEGYGRKNARVNLDHRISPKLNLSVTGYLTDAYRDDPVGAFNPFQSLYLIDPQADLAQRDSTGELALQPDARAEVENPLYVIDNTDIDMHRRQLLGNLSVRFNPTPWFDVEGSVSYDRWNYDEERFYDKGFQTINPNTVNNGRYVKENRFRQAVNANLTASLSRTFGDFTTRTKGSVLVEREYYNQTYVRGDGLATRGVRSLNNVVGTIFRGSEVRDQRGVYGFLATQTDYRDRYIADLLIRRDGSSLFGPEERWHTYFRASGAYRLSQERWWPLRESVNEFKLRYSYGTAGAQPAFAAQYETFGINDGKVTKLTFGNRQLKPERQTEQEVGLNVALFDRVSAELVYANARIEDQLLRVPLPAPYGYSFQWRNAGTIESKTVEASLEAVLLQERDRRWSLSLIFDRTRQRMVAFDLPPFRAGPFDAFQYQAGEELGAIYGHNWARSVAELPEEWRPYASAFVVNDDGYLVAVGVGNSWGDGFSRQLWGTMVDVDGDGQGDLEWGMPLRSPAGRVKIGSSIPDFNVGANSTFQWKGLRAFMLWSAQVGGDIYNRAKQRAYSGVALAHGDLDQAGKPEERKKPVSYYQAFYLTSSTSSHFIEDASFLKLRELSLSYDFNNQALRRLFGERVAGQLHSASIGLVGRNLLTFTPYSGFDPEVGLNNFQDATLIRFDDFQYPSYRTFTARVELQF